MIDVRYEDDVAREDEDVSCKNKGLKVRCFISMRP